MIYLNTQNIFCIVFLLFINTCSSQKNDANLEKLVKLTKNKMHLNYSLVKEEIGDFNKDNKKDIILIFKSKNNDEEIETLDSPVIVLLSTTKNYERFENSNILYSFIPNNSVLDDNLVMKNEFFTIEQTMGNGNDKEKKYITFKFDNNKIFLYKYGVETSFPGKTKIITSTKIYSKKDFGIIAFKDFNLNDIQNKLTK